MDLNKQNLGDGSCLMDDVWCDAGVTDGIIIL
jgi:hypothetical protein